MEPIPERAVLLIYTGGTIGMKTNPATGSLAPFDFDQIETEVPELRKFGVRIDTVAFDPVLDSSNVGTGEWVRLAEIIRDRYEQYTGFVVLHGTDTMAYSASALSFMLENLAKPVIFTGSQIPIGVLRTDGRENLISAIEIAAAGCVPEVCIYFQTLLLRANRTIKYNAEHFDAFRSPNCAPLAEAGIAITYRDGVQVCALPVRPLRVHTQLETRVAVIRIFPGMREEVFRAMLAVEGLRGVVLEPYGSGNAPTREWFIRVVREAIEQRGMTLINVTQCPAGVVDMERYDTGRELLRAGVVGGGDMTTEAALAKLMYLLGQSGSKAELETGLRTSLRGEISY